LPVTSCHIPQFDTHLF